MIREDNDSKWFGIVPGTYRKITSLGGHWVSVKSLNWAHLLQSSWTFRFLPNSFHSKQPVRYRYRVYNINYWISIFIPVLDETILLPPPFFYLSPRLCLEKILRVETPRPLFCWTCSSVNHLILFPSCSKKGIGHTRQKLFFLHFNFPESSCALLSW